MARMYLGKATAFGDIQWVLDENSGSTKTDEWGYFEIEGILPQILEPGNHKIRIQYMNRLHDWQEAFVKVPKASPFFVVSDIDDTVLISHSGKFRKRMAELLLRPTFRRRLFAETANLFEKLEYWPMETGVINPIFYVSASEWNLLPYLKAIFKNHGLPEGTFLLHPRRHWTHLLGGPMTPPEDKKNRIERLMGLFPDRKAILLGDNSQADPDIFLSLSLQFPNQIQAVFIRMVRKKKAFQTMELLQKIKQMGIDTMPFIHSKEILESLNPLFLK